MSIVILCFNKKWKIINDSNYAVSVWSLLSTSNLTRGEDIEVFPASDFFAFIETELIALIVQTLDFSNDSRLWEVTELCKRNSCC